MTPYLLTLEEFAKNASELGCRTILQRDLKEVGEHLASAVTAIDLSLDAFR
jgi:hypothetical protein